MTRNEIKKYLPIIQAFAEGTDIEYYDRSTEEWRLATVPTFSSGVDYRIKVEPEYRPFNSKEECWDEMRKHKPFGWITDGDSNYNINIMNDSLVMASDFKSCIFARTYKDALKSLKFIDETPFGIQVK
jgi:hypothetical protein